MTPTPAASPASVPVVTIPSGISWDTLRRRLGSLDVTLEQIASKHGVVLSAEEEGTEGLPKESSTILALFPVGLAAHFDLGFRRMQGRGTSVADALGKARAEIRRTVAFLEEALARRAAVTATTPTTEDLYALREIDRQTAQCFARTLDAMVQLRSVRALQGTPELGTLNAAWLAAAIHGAAGQEIAQAWSTQHLPPLRGPTTITVKPSGAFAGQAAAPTLPTKTRR